MATCRISNALTRRSRAPQCRRGRRRGASPPASRNLQVEAPASSRPYPMPSNRPRRRLLRPYPRRQTARESPATPRSSWSSTTSRPTGKSPAPRRDRNVCQTAGCSGLTSGRSYDSLLDQKHLGLVRPKGPRNEAQQTNEIKRPFSLDDELVMITDPSIEIPQYKSSNMPVHHGSCTLKVFCFFLIVNRMQKKGTFCTVKIRPAG